MPRLTREAKETVKPAGIKETTNCATDAATSHTQATKSAQPVALSVTIATNTVISARFARKETKYTKYRTKQLMNKKITLTMMIFS
jgi:hypothetical protein